MGKLIEEVKANSAKRSACPRHRFDGLYKFGQKVTCTNCGAWMGATEASYYCEGFKAAGGDPAEVWPAVYG